MSDPTRTAPRPPDRPHDRPGPRRVARLAALAAATVALAACVPETPPTVGAAFTVTPTAMDVPPGTTVVVHGTGYAATGNLGTRPPFFGQPAGVYVVFGRFAETWRPSQGATSASRQIIQQVWALPQAQHDVLDPDGSNAAIVLMAPDGSFEADLQLTPADGTGAYGIATYPGSGATNSGEELLEPVTFAVAD